MMMGVHCADPSAPRAAHPLQVVAASLRILYSARWHDELPNLAGSETRRQHSESRDSRLV